MRRGVAVSSARMAAALPVAAGRACAWRVAAPVAAAAPSWSGAVPSTCRAMCMASKQTREREAAKMAFPVPTEAFPVTERSVPTSAKEYETARRQYEMEVSKLRKMYKAQWDLRREVEAAEARERRRRVMVRKAENKRLRDIRRKKIAARHEKTRAQANKTAEADRNYRLAARNAYLARVAEKRQAWLKALDEESRSWIPEDKIDEMITPDTFEMTYPWHLEEWYARRERRRKIKAARARGENITEEVEEADEPNYLAVVGQQKELAIRAATLAGKGGDGYANVDPLELLEGDESIFVGDSPEHTRTNPQRSLYAGAWESDDDLLDGFGSDWEEDVPKLDWFGRSKAMARTGIQLEELYAEEGMLNIKARLDAFEEAHDHKFPLPDASPEFWATMAREMQQGHYSEPKYLRDKEAELTAPFEAEAERRRAILEELAALGPDTDEEEA